MATNQELTNTQNQWQVLSDVMQRIWETMNGNLVAPPNFPREVIDMLDENIRIFYFDLLRLYDVTVILERAASAGSFRGFFPNSTALNNLPISSMREGDFAYLVSPATIWTWTEENGWANSGVAVPTGVAAPSSINPLADNQAGQRGTNNTFALADHRHPFSPEFNQARNDIANLFNQVQQRYIRPAAGIPITDLDSDLRQFILDTRGTLFFPIMVNTTAAPVGARVNDYIRNESTGERSVGNLTTYIGDLVKIVSLNPFQVIMAGNNRGPRGEHGTTTFRIVNNTAAAPAGARVNDLIMNTGTDARTVGNRVYQIGDIGEITSLVPFQVSVPGNNRGPRGLPGRDALPFPTIIVGTTAEGGDGTLSNCDFLCDGENDMPMILAAINEIPATGGRVLFRMGNYTISGNTSAMLIHGLHLEGVGKMECIITMHTSINAIASFVRISNFTFNAIPTLSFIFNTSQLNNFEVDNCIFRMNNESNPGSGVQVFRAGSQGSYNNTKIHHNIFEITGGIISDINQNVIVTAFHIRGLINCIISDNTFIITNNNNTMPGNSLTGLRLSAIAIESLAGVTIRGLIITNNTFTLNAPNINMIRHSNISTIAIRAPSNALSNIIIKGNDFSQQIDHNIAIYSDGGNIPTIRNFIDSPYNFAQLNASVLVGFNTLIKHKSKKSVTVIIGNSDFGHMIGDVDFLVNGSASNNVAATPINAAIALLPDTGGKIILREGRYRITTANFNKPIILEGMGTGTSLETNTTRINAPNCRITNMTLIGLISVENHNCTIDNCMILTSIRTINNTPLIGSVRNFILEKNKIEPSTLHATSLILDANGLSEGNIIRNNIITISITAFQNSILAVSNNAIIENNIINISSLGRMSAGPSASGRIHAITENAKRIVGNIININLIFSTHNQGVFAIMAADYMQGNDISIKITNFAGRCSLFSVGASTRIIHSNNIKMEMESSLETPATGRFFLISFEAFNNFNIFNNRIERSVNNFDFISYVASNWVLLATGDMPTSPITANEVISTLGISTKIGNVGFNDVIDI